MESQLNLCCTHDNEENSLRKVHAPDAAKILSRSLSAVSEPSSLSRYLTNGGGERVSYHLKFALFSVCIMLKISDILVLPPPCSISGEKGKIEMYFK